MPHLQQSLLILLRLNLGAFRALAHPSKTEHKAPPLVSARVYRSSSAEWLNGGSAYIL